MFAGFSEASVIKIDVAVGKIAAEGLTRQDHVHGATLGTVAEFVQATTSTVIFRNVEGVGIGVVLSLEPFKDDLFMKAGIGYAHLNAVGAVSGERFSLATTVESKKLRVTLAILIPPECEGMAKNEVFATVAHSHAAEPQIVFITSGLDLFIG